MDKTALRTALLALEGQELQAARQAYADYLAAAKPEEDLQDDAESHSLNVQDAELAEGLDAPLHSAEDAMARLQAIDFGPKSTVAPGAVLWPEAGNAYADTQQIIDRTPLRRAGTPEDVAGTVLWLLREATFVTGQVVRVDGGRSIVV